MKFDPRVSYAYSKFLEAHHLCEAARLLEFSYRSTDEKDKVVDMLTIRRLRTLSDNIRKEAVKELSYFPDENDGKDKLRVITQEEISNSNK